MRIVAGSRGGRKLQTLDVRHFRPTSDRVREAVFSILAGRIMGARVLDLFAGSGALGFEALSRGAEKVTFVESGRNLANLIERNGKALGFEDRYTVIRADVRRFIVREAARGDHDVWFVDPPYRGGLVQPVLDAAAGAVVLPLVIVERDKREEWSAPLSEWSRARRYGDTVVEFLIQETEEEA